MSLVTHREGDFSFAPLVWTCSRSFYFLSAAASKNVLTGKLAIKQLQADFITTRKGKFYYNVRLVLIRLLSYKIGQLFGTIFLLYKAGKWYYKVRQGL